MNIAIVSFQDNSDIIGAKYIHAFLLSKGHNSHLVLQYNADAASDEALFAFIADKQIEMVGISLMSGEFFRARQFAQGFKSRFGSKLLVFGGIHATIAPEECLEVGDVVVRGEGEHTMLELVQCIEANRDYSEISGICLKLDGQCRCNPMRPLETDIDVFPFPKHRPDNMYAVTADAVSYVDAKLFRSISRYSGKFPNIITTRGCPFACTYCCNSALKEVYGKYPVRKRSVQSVIAELAEIVAENEQCTTLNIQDDCFLTYNNEWIRSFSERYANEIKIPFVIRTTPLHINTENLALLKKAGLAMVMMGLQSGSDRINKEVFRRSTTGKSFLNAARTVKELGLAAYYDVILDNPYETDEDILHTIQILLQTPKPFQLVLFSLCFYQGTELYRRATAEGLPFNDPRSDDYGQIDATVLNKLISLTPNFPAGFVRTLVNHRDRGDVKFGINLCVLLNIAVLRPVSFLLLMHRAYGSSLRTTSRLVKDFGKTAISKMLKI